MGRGTAKRKQHIGYDGRLSDCADEFMQMVEKEAGLNSIYEDHCLRPRNDLQFTDLLQKTICLHLISSRLMARNSING
jgi:hypothetical protein